MHTLNPIALLGQIAPLDPQKLFDAGRVGRSLAATTLQHPDLGMPALTGPDPVKQYKFFGSQRNGTAMIVVSDAS
jgi:hypothetical protein